MYFWSSDGFNFHLMQEKPGCSSYENEKTVQFYTSDQIEDVETVCIIKFTSNRAIILEPWVTDKSCNNEKNDEFIKGLASIISNNLEDFDFENYVPPPPSKELMSFNQCPKRAIELMLQFILSGHINMFPYSISAANSRQTPLDIIEKYKNKNLSAI